MQLIKSYLKDRVIEIATVKSLKMKMRCPEGSMLGPTLWNLYYEFLDLVASSKTGEDISRDISTSVQKIKQWMELRGLSLAVQKKRRQ